MSRKKLLVLTPRFPYPVIGGDRLRIYHICKALSQKFDITLLTFCDTKGELEYIPSDGVFKNIYRVYRSKWRSIRNTVCAVLGSKPLQLMYYYSADFKAICQTLVPNHDLVLAHLIRTGQYLEDINSSVPRILEMTDAISLNYARIKNISGQYNLKKIVYRFEQERLYRYEQKTIHHFERVWLVSEIDRSFISKDKYSNVEILPNGVDLKRLTLRSSEGKKNVIVFIGNMVSVQNQDACFFFIKEIFPIILQKIDVRFRIVGNASPTLVRKFQQYHNVEATGPIENITDGLQNAFASICSVRAAAGLQNKVLEYLALGLPCVTSEVGLEGINAIPGKHLLVFRTSEEAAKQIFTLHSDADLRKRLAFEGRAFVEHNYAWPKIYSKFIQSAESIALCPIKKARVKSEW